MIAIIPAKKNSKRLPNKNIKQINGKPLIWYTIKSALNSKNISKTIVSTDCKKIAKMSIKFGAEVPFLRPKNLANSKTPTIKVCKHALNFFKKKEKRNYKEIIVLQPTSPLRTSQDIDNCIKIFKKKKADLVASFSEAKPKQWYKELMKDGKFDQFMSKDNNGNQSSKKNFLVNGAVYIFSKKFFNTKIKKKICYGYIMPKKRSIDIDYIEDFKIAKKELENKNISI